MPSSCTAYKSPAMIGVQLRIGPSWVGNQSTDDDIELVHKSFEVERACQDFAHQHAPT